MTSVESLGRLFVLIGILFVLAGALLMLAGKIPWFGKLPGDILIEKKNFTFYFPVATSILLSILLSIIVWFLGRR